MPRLQKYEAFAVHLALHFTIPSGFHQVNYVCWHVHVCAGCGKIQRDLVRTVQECCSIIRRALFEAFWSCFRVHWCRRTAGTREYSEFCPLISFFIFLNATLKSTCSPGTGHPIWHTRNSNVHLHERQEGDRQAGRGQPGRSPEEVRSILPGEMTDDH